jgi:hypothetical protein
MKCHILTFEANDYDQHGEYFLYAFAEEPTPAKLGLLIGEADPATLAHILSGGGRRNTEQRWYHLRETELL